MNQIVSDTLAAPAISAASRLAPILEARSVAIVGASADPQKVSGRPLAYMLARGFKGKLFPVNPARNIVQGLKSYPSLASIGEPVDLAIIGTPAAQVEEIVREGIEAGIRGFVIFSSGFSELDEAGAELQRRLTALADTHGVSILGPNCLGAVNSQTGLAATFTTALEENTFLYGGFAFVSQSGALGAYWMDICLRSGLGFSKWITTGNECDVDAAAAIDYLADDPDTKVIGVYIEDIRHGHAFRLALMKAAAKGKPVIAIKSGRSAAGVAAAASHTGALAGDDALYDACLTQYGALRVDSLTRMIDIARLYLYGAVPAGNRLAVMSVSGGAGVMIADEAEEWGLTLPPLSAETAMKLRQCLPSFVHPANPLDLTGNVVQNSRHISLALEAVASEPGTDGIVLFVGLMHSIAAAFTDALATVRKKTSKPIVVVWIGAKEETVSVLEQARICVFRDIPPAIAALGQSVQLSALRQKALGQLSLSVGRQATVSPAQTAVAWSEWDSKQALRKAGITSIPEGLLLPLEAAEANPPTPASWPTVAKLQSDTLLHKSDVGGVILNIKDAEGLKSAVAQLCEVAREHGIVAQGALVEPMLPYDHELLVGLRRDTRFGESLTLGRGGVNVELEADVATALLPLSEQHVKDLLRSLRGARRFEGFRGGKPLNFDVAAKAIVELYNVFSAHPEFAEIEINPLVVSEERAWILDAIVRRFE